MHGLVLSCLGPHGRTFGLTSPSSRFLVSPMTAYCCLDSRTYVVVLMLTSTVAHSRSGAYQAEGHRVNV